MKQGILVIGTVLSLALFCEVSGRAAGDISPSFDSTKGPDPIVDCNSNGQDDSKDVAIGRGSRLFSDDFDDKLEDKWIATGLWHLEEYDCLADAPPDQDPPSKSRAAYNKGKDDCTYNTGARNYGVLEMNTSVTLPSLGGEIEWWNWIETEDLPGVDTWLVQVSDDNGATWKTILDGQSKSEPTWTQYVVPFPPEYNGKQVKVRFFFDTRDKYSNDFGGWYIDSFAIYGYDRYSEDCNSNGIPDECEPDCNANGIPDECDLTTGTSTDCNGNGIPDECDANDEVTTTSPKFEPFDADHSPVSWTVPHPAPARSSVRLRLTAQGTLGTSFDNRIDVYVNNTLAGQPSIRLVKSPCGSGMKDLILSGSLFNQLTNNGAKDAEFRFEAGPDISPRCESSYLQVSLAYLTHGEGKDCNANNVPDECDIQSGTSRDCNANGVPDECDIAQGTSPDCNANGVPDECDIEYRTSADCNANGVPDECDIAQGTSPDCNANGVPDECDIEYRTSGDCNANGVPDECDIAAGLSEDCDLGGVPDECEIQKDSASCGGELTATAFWFDDFENPAADRWTTVTLSGKCTWQYPPPDMWLYPFSGRLHLWGGRLGDVSDSAIEMKEFVEIPTTVPSYLSFKHFYDFEAFPANFDGGIIEYLTDDAGTTWTDIGPFIETNGYRGTIASGYHNPLQGRDAFVCTSLGYITTRINLTPLAGKKIKIRFRVGTDWAGFSNGWFIDDVQFSICEFKTDQKIDNDFVGSPLGWTELSRIPQAGNYARTAYDAEECSLCSWVTPDASRYRVVGWFTDAGARLPYGAVGPQNFVRAKFYVYAKGQDNPAQLNTIPNFRMRVANRFAVNSMLEVNAHVNASSGDEPITLEVRPSQDPSRPSLYRIDFDPIDVPQLVNNPWTESILRGFEAYALDPQDSGYVCLAESSIGVYPKSFVTPEKSALMWLKTYQTGPSDAGDFSFSNPDTQIDLVSLLITGDGTPPIRDYDITPGVWADVRGLTMDSTDFDNYLDGYRIGVVSVDLGAGQNAQRVRVEPGKEYMVRYHVTSSQHSNRNPQLRLRARCLRFGWVQKLEIGGAWAINTPEHVALASQSLPGIGCMNPDKIGSENGGWYTLLIHSPLDPDIRPEVEGSVCDKMPNLCSQPGPGSPNASIRDLKVGVDLIDTMSTSIYKDLEAGNFTVDRIEVFSFNRIPD